MTLVQPINDDQRLQVRLKAEACIRRAAERFGIDIDPVQIDFDLGGRSAGMYMVRKRQRRIRFNPWIFARYFDDSLHSTVPHEVAHYVTDILHGLRYIKPHGREWREVMRVLDVEPRVTGDYDLTGIPVRRQRRFGYRCECMTHELSTRRHNNILNGRTRYFCRRCKTGLVFTGQ